MQPAHVRWIRQRKFALYERLLPGCTSILATVDVNDEAAYLRALVGVARLAPDGFGIAVGAHRKLADLGVLGHVTMSCATLREALDLWMIFADNAGEPVTFLSSISLVNDLPRWALEIRSRPNVSAAVAALLADELAAAFFSFAREMTGRDFTDFTTELVHQHFVGVPYDTALHGPVFFSRPVTRITGPAAVLDLAIDLKNDDPLATLIDRLGGNQDELKSIKPMTLKVYEFLVRRRTETPTLHQAALTMRVSSRTLVRRLAEEGTHFGAVLDDFRRRYTLTLAEHGGLQAKQIAHLVGFASENGLRKAFRKWTGQPIGVWTLDQRRHGSLGIATIEAPDK